MSFSLEDLRDIYDRTCGKCHICHKKVAFTNYGQFGEVGNWEVEHSVARARGGTSRRNNLYPACISCNRSKQAVTTRTARSWNGKRRAPLSRTRRAEQQLGNTIAGATLGTVVVALIAPEIWVLGLIVGALFGSDADPDA
jgi:hypothetical protein